MNGVSLLVALAAVGIDVGWETAADGTRLYSITVEQLYLEPLRKGTKVLVSDVDARPASTAIQDPDGAAGGSSRHIRPSKLRTGRSFRRYGQLRMETERR